MIKCSTPTEAAQVYTQKERDNDINEATTTTIKKNRERSQVHAINTYFD